MLLHWLRGCDSPSLGQRSIRPCECGRPENTCQFSTSQNPNLKHLPNFKKGLFSDLTYYGDKTVSEE